MQNRMQFDGSDSSPHWLRNFVVVVVVLTTPLVAIFSHSTIVAGAYIILATKICDRVFGRSQGLLIQMLEAWAEARRPRLPPPN